MNINFKQPKYILPLLALPFLCLFFFVYRSSLSTDNSDLKQEKGLNGSVGNVSADVRKKNLSDKLDAYRNTYKEADGYSAVNIIPKETSADPSFKDAYSEKEKQMLDSIDQAMKAKFSASSDMARDQKLASVLNNAPPVYHPVSKVEVPKERDPMEVFRQQMAYMDSMGRSNDPALKAEQKKKTALEKAAALKAAEVRLTVTKADAENGDFNTVRPSATKPFITAVIDENVTGYAGSRLRLKLLEDIKAGENLIPKGTLLFAQISGFSEQRVTLIINTVLSEGKILPVKLEIYDLDGMPGLYVPSSAFREFTRELGSSSVQGVTIDDNSAGSQFIMSSVDKIFQSTSSAIAGLIRKNKARMKYNSYVYLIDTERLQNTQRSY